MASMEIRVEFDEDDMTVAVLDAVQHGEPGESRTSIVKRVLREWAEKEMRRAQRIVRVTRQEGNPTEAESKRSRGG